MELLNSAAIRDECASASVLNMLLGSSASMVAMPDEDPAAACSPRC